MQVSRRTFIGGAAATVALSGVASASAGTTIRILSSWPQNVSMVYVGETPFIAAVEKASNGGVKFARNGPEAVPSFEQLQPLSAGVFDLLYTSPSYHQSDTGMGPAMDGLLTADVGKLRETGVIDWLNDYYREKFGVVILGVIACPPNHFVLKEPIGESGDLTGRKVRSNALFDGILHGLGAIPVGLPASDIYGAMQRGVVDGTVVVQYATADYKFYEVGKYMTRPGFGHTKLILMANARSFDALPQDVQELLRDEALKMEKYAAEEMIAVAVAQNATMEENGASVTEFSAEVAAKLPKLFFDGTADVARKSDAAAIDALIEFAGSKGALSYQ